MLHMAATSLAVPAVAAESVHVEGLRLSGLACDGPGRVRGLSVRSAGHRAATTPAVNPCSRHAQPHGHHDHVGDDEVARIDVLIIVVGRVGCHSGG